MKLFMILCMLLFLNLSVNANSNAKEDKIKGIVLERITQFITYKNQIDRFTVCVYSDTRLTKVFKKLYTRSQYKNKDINVIEVNSVSKIKSCSVLYVNNLNKKVIKEIVKNIKHKVLLVTQNIDNIYDGFMIAMYFEDRKIKFAINHAAIDRADLKVNYRLLKIASKVINPIKK